MSNFGRRAVPVTLLLLGAGAVVLAVVARQVTWKAVWIGVASTCLAAGLVDGSALIEARRRERVLLQLAGERVGALHQSLLWILVAVFDVEIENPADVSRRLRAPNVPAIDLHTRLPGGEPPPRTRLVGALQYLAQVNDALAVAISLGAQTNEAERFQLLDEAVRSSVFIAWLRRHAVRDAPRPDPGELAGYRAQLAADLLDAVQQQFRFFAARASKSWRYGNLE